MSTITVLSPPSELEETSWVPFADNQVKLSKIIPATNGIHDGHVSELPSHDPQKIKEANKKAMNGHTTV